MKEVRIENCGEIPEGEDITPPASVPDNDPYADYPADQAPFEKTVARLQAVDIIKTAGNKLFREKQLAQAVKKYQKVGPPIHLSWLFLFACSQTPAIRPSVCDTSQNQVIAMKKILPLKTQRP